MAFLLGIFGNYNEYIFTFVNSSRHLQKSKKARFQDQQQSNASSRYRSFFITLRYVLLLYIHWCELILKHYARNHSVKKRIANCFSLLLDISGRFMLHLLGPWREKTSNCPKTNWIVSRWWSRKKKWASSISCRWMGRKWTSGISLSWTIGKE